jgi:hypothetical protein
MVRGEEKMDDEGRRISRSGSRDGMPRRRGKWTAQQRRRIVADSRVAGASVQEVARAARCAREFIVSVAASRRIACGEAGEVCRGQVSAAPADGSIEIDLVAGCVRVRGIVDGTMLREVLAAAR